MEGGIHKAESTEFRDLLYLTSKQPFILRLAFSAGIGGLLFGYDTGPSPNSLDIMFNNPTCIDLTRTSLRRRHIRSTLVHSRRFQAGREEHRAAGI
jgi:hypothetical protein